MKILTTIPVYSENNPYIKRVVNQLTPISDVVIFSPHSYNIPGVHVELRNKNLQHALVFEPRQYILDHLDEYDYFFYNEDDVLYSTPNIKYAIEVNEKISKIDLQNNVSFIRYEVNEKNSGEFVDLHPCHSVHLGGNGVSDVIRYVTRIDGEYYFVPWNLHCGSFLFSRDQIQLLLDNGLYTTTPNTKYCGILESGASEFNLYFRKLIPTANWRSFLGWHMSNKYIFNPVKIDGDFLDNLFRFIPEDLAGKYL